MTDIVTEMLRFGKTNLIAGFTQQNLIEYLTSKGFQLERVQNIISLYFRDYFVYQGGGQQNVLTTIYFLKPNGYFDLLQIESTFESREQSKNANCIATISIIISGILALAAILTTVLYTPDVKLNDNEQLKELIDSGVQNRIIIQQIQQDIKSINDTLVHRTSNCNHKK
jgi:hypothetical protein